MRGARLQVKLGESRDAKRAGVINNTKDMCCLKKAFYPKIERILLVSVTEIPCCAAEAQTTTSGGAAASSPGDDQRTRHASQAQNSEHAQTHRQSTGRCNVVILQNYSSIVYKDIHTEDS